MNPVEDFLSELNGEPTDENEKTAGFLGNLWQGLKGGMTRAPVTQAMPISGSFGRAVGEGLPLAVAGAAMAGLGGAAGKGYRALKERFTKPRDYKAMLEANPALRKEPAKKVQMVYNSLRTMAPTMAKDPLVAGSFIRDTIALSPEAGTAISPQTAKLLVETQRNIADAKGTGAMMRAWTSGESWKGIDAPQKDTPFMMGPGGLSGRFGSAEEAAEFAKAHKLPKRGVQKPDMPYSMGPQGLSGRFKTPDEAAEFAKAHRLPKRGVGRGGRSR